MKLRLSVRVGGGGRGVGLGLVGVARAGATLTGGTTGGLAHTKAAAGARCGLALTNVAAGARGGLALTNGTAGGGRRWWELLFGLECWGELAAFIGGPDGGSIGLKEAIVGREGWKNGIESVLAESLGCDPWGLGIDTALVDSFEDCRKEGWCGGTYSRSIANEAGLPCAAWLRFLRMLSTILRISGLTVPTVALL